jgi:hypothetical protein
MLPEYMVFVNVRYGYPDSIDRTPIPVVNTPGATGAERYMKFR